MTWPPDPPEQDLLEIQCPNCYGLGNPQIREVPATYTGLDEDGHPEWEIDEEDAVCPSCGESDWSLA